MEQPTKQEQRRVDRYNRKVYPRCFPWRHRWINSQYAGSITLEYLERCDNCGWWKFWSIGPTSTWTKLYPPYRFEKENNVQTPGL